MEARPVSLTSLLLIVGTLLACAVPDISPAPSSQPPSTVSPMPPSPPTSSPQAWPLKDMTARPQIWFGPLDPPEWSQANPGVEAYDFFQLFHTGSPWPRTSDAVRVMVLYPVWLDGLATPSQLQQVFADLRQRQIAVAFESGPLSEHGPCNAGTIEGFSGAGAARHIAQRIQANGGVLYAMEMEHGFDAATYYDPACSMTPQEIAQDAARTIASVRQVFPDVIVGSIETADLDPAAVADWLSAYQQVTGEPLGFFHLDVNFNIPDWAKKARAIQDVVQARGVPFGIYYVGDPADPTDSAWYDHARERMEAFEILQGGQPDDAILQSWNPRPQRLLPEDQPGTYTNFVLSYLRPRSSLSLTLDQGVAGGGLYRAGGAPIPNASIEFSALPLSGQGVWADDTLSGVVPEGATAADVGFRVNTECNCSGPAHFSLGSVSYIENGQGSSQVPNSRFANGLQGWGTWGAGSARLTQGENGTGRALSVGAESSQDVGLNSDSFAVHAGLPFAITFRVRVDPLTQASGYFDIVFLSDAGEVQRMTLPIEVARLAIGSAVTQSDGSFALGWAPPGSGTYQVRAWFNGNDEVWPAVAEQTLGP
jgi:hypothetical protein